MSSSYYSAIHDVLIRSADSRDDATHPHSLKFPVVPSPDGDGWDIILGMKRRDAKLVEALVRATLSDNSSVPNREGILFTCEFPEPITGILADDERYIAEVPVRELSITAACIGATAAGARLFDSAVTFYGMPESDGSYSEVFVSGITDSEFSRVQAQLETAFAFSIAPVLGVPCIDRMQK